MRLCEPLACLSLSLLLGGCATAALELAPARPDRPWTAVPSGSGETAAGAHSTAAGYVLPPNPALAVLPAPPVVDAARVYALPGLIDIAESANPRTRVAWNDARHAALAAGIAESAFLPVITATAVAGYQASDGHSNALGLTLAGDTTAKGTISAVSVQWLLFDFGQRSAVVDAAQQASTISNIAFNAAHQQLIYDVAVAFYAHAAARARLATAAQSLKNAHAVQAAAEDRYAHGVGTVIEVAQARQATAQAKVGMVAATGGVQNTRLALLAAMGISPLTRIRIADVAGRTLSSAMASPIETIIARALSRRPDVQSAYAAAKASLAGVKAAEADFYPKFFLAATGAYNTGTLGVTALPGIGQQPPTVNISGNRLGANVFAGVTVPLFDGGVRAATLAQARAQADSAKARLDQIREDAVHQIAVADNALKTSLAAYSASATLVKAAQTTFDAALAAYKSSVGSITDVTVAATQLIKARNAAADSYSTALTAAATLALAIGALGAAPDTGD